MPHRWRLVEAGILCCALTGVAAAQSPVRLDLIPEGLTYEKAIDCMGLELAATPSGFTNPYSPFPYFEAWARHLNKQADIASDVASVKARFLENTVDDKILSRQSQVMMQQSEIGTRCSSYWLDYGRKLRYEDMGRTPPNP